MQTIGIKTAQNIDIDYEVAGLGERIIARIIDYSLYLAIILLYLLIFRNVTSHAVLYNFTLPQILFFIFYGFYDVVAELIFNGQSLGKYIMKIRVISLDGARPRVGQYLLRYVFRLVDFGITFGVAAIVSVAITDNRQRIGDIVANTTLIKTKRRTGFEELDNLEVDESYQPVFFDATNLSDKDIALIHEVINHFYKTGDVTLVDNMARRVKAFLSITDTGELNNYKFLKTILKDYNHFTVNMNPQIG
ncbi:RDD family protein [Mucilaginibacter sp. AW1-3]